MRITRRLMLMAPVAAGLMLGLTGVAQAQWKPSKPVTIIVPWAAGGATDQVTRLAAAELEQPLPVLRESMLESLEQAEIRAGNQFSGIQPTWLWAILSLVRAAIQIPLIQAGQLAWLGATPFLFYGLVGITIAASWWVIKRTLPPGHPGIRRPQIPAPA